MRKIKLVIIENEKEICNELRAAVTSDSRFELVYLNNTARDLASMIRVSPSSVDADIIIVSYELKDNGAVRIIDALSGIPYSERPYLIVTSRVFNSVIIGYLSSIGACDFVHKPYTADQMLNRLSYLYAYLNNIAPANMDLKYETVYSDAVHERNRLTLGREEQRLITGITYELLMNSQIPITSSGFKYLVQAVSIVYHMKKESFHIMKDIYPKLAALNLVTSETVERCMRSAIERGWTRRKSIRTGSERSDLFSRFSRKPTNSELITYTAYCVKKIIDNQLNIS